MTGVFFFQIRVTRPLIFRMNYRPTYKTTWPWLYLLVPNSAGSVSSPCYVWKHKSMLIIKRSTLNMYFAFLIPVKAFWFLVPFSVKCEHSLSPSFDPGKSASSCTLEENWQTEKFNWSTNLMQEVQEVKLLMRRKSNMSELSTRWQSFDERIMEGTEVWKLFTCHTCTLKRNTES